MTLNDKEAERPPDISKLTLSLEEMAPHTNPRYGRDEIGLGNMFADFFKPIARYNSERGIWFVYDGVVWQPDMENLKVAELAKYLADKLYLFALKITEEDVRKRFIDRVRKLQQRKHRDTMLKDAKSRIPTVHEAVRSGYLSVQLQKWNTGSADDGIPGTPPGGFSHKSVPCDICPGCRLPSLADVHHGDHAGG